MTRRTWTPRDPEPDDHPDVVDGHGDLWRWEGQHGQDPYSGWWSPTAGCFDLTPWNRIWDAEGGDCDCKISEVFPDEVDELIS